jgi:hypothetical protein
MEYPPLWIWAIIIGIIIGTKFVIRWNATKLISRKHIDYHNQNAGIESRIKKDSENYNSNKKVRNIRSYKYGPFRLYKRRLTPKKD